MSDDQFWDAIKQVESGGDENAVGDNGMSIGLDHFRSKELITMMLLKEILRCSQASMLAINTKTAREKEVLSTVGQWQKATWIDMLLKDVLVILLLMKTRLVYTMEDPMAIKCQLLSHTGKR